MVDSVAQVFYVLNDFLSTYSFNYLESVVEISNYSVDLSISPFGSTSFCFMYLGDRLLNAYTFQIVMSS